MELGDVAEELELESKMLAKHMAVSIGKAAGLGHQSPHEAALTAAASVHKAMIEKGVTEEEAVEFASFCSGLAASEAAMVQGTTPEVASSIAATEAQRAAVVAGCPTDLSLQCGALAIGAVVAKLAAQRGWNHSDAATMAGQFLQRFVDANTIASDHFVAMTAMATHEAAEAVALANGFAPRRAAEIGAEEIESQMELHGKAVGLADSMGFHAAFGISERSPCLSVPAEQKGMPHCRQHRPERLMNRYGNLHINANVWRIARVGSDPTPGPRSVKWTYGSLVVFAGLRYQIWVTLLEYLGSAGGVCVEGESYIRTEGDRRGNRFVAVVGRIDGGFMTWITQAADLQKEDACRITLSTKAFLEPATLSMTYTDRMQRHGHGFVQCFLELAECEIKSPRDDASLSSPERPSDPRSDPVSPREADPAPQDSSPRPALEELLRPKPPSFPIQAMPPEDKRRGARDPRDRPTPRLRGGPERAEKVHPPREGEKAQTFLQALEMAKAQKQREGAMAKPPKREERSRPANIAAELRVAAIRSSQPQETSPSKSRRRASLLHLIQPESKKADPFAPDVNALYVGAGQPRQQASPPGSEAASRVASKANMSPSRVRPDADEARAPFGGVSPSTSITSIHRDPRGPEAVESLQDVLSVSVLSTDSKGFAKPFKPPDNEAPDDSGLESDALEALPRKAESRAPRSSRSSRSASREPPKRQPPEQAGSEAEVLVKRVQESLDRKFGSVDAAFMNMSARMNRLSTRNGTEGAQTAEEKEDRALMDLRQCMVESGVSFKDATLFLQAMRSSLGGAPPSVQDVVNSLMPGHLLQDAVDQELRCPEKPRKPHRQAWHAAPSSSWQRRSEHQSRQHPGHFEPECEEHPGASGGPCGAADGACTSRRQLAEPLREPISWEALRANGAQPLAVSIEAEGAYGFAVLSHFPDKLLKSGGLKADGAAAGGESVDTASVFEGKKAVGLYFSAHWCPPCRGFTPKLAEAYKAHLKDKGLEIVFVSSDKSEEEFNSYFGEMPWLALPFSERTKKNDLSKKFKVSGIPTFVIINAENGSVITADGRSAVMSDPEGKKFPWIPPTFQEALGDEFMDGEETVDKKKLEGKTLGLYFSAHWCPPCRAFTPQLAKWYAGIKSELGDKFEIIFCSGDRDEASMKEYYKEQREAGGKWLAMPYHRKDDLDPLFEIQGIPTFLIVSPEGKVINKNGRSLTGALASEFPWHPPVIGSLEDPEGINETPCMCLMLESCEPALQKRILEAVTPIAEKYVKSGEMLFFASKSPSSVSTQIRALCGLESVSQVSKVEKSADPAGPSLVRTLSSDTPTLILLDIPDSGGFYVGKMAKELDGSGVQAMIDGWKGKSLERKQLSKS
ncbi:NXN [Symbiodinium sp. KB8]|nr:NXN [Symbiodinium sp. KB8]